MNPSSSSIKIFQVSSLQLIAMLLSIKRAAHLNSGVWMCLIPMMLLQPTMHVQKRVTPTPTRRILTSQPCSQLCWGYSHCQESELKVDGSNEPIPENIPVDGNFSPDYLSKGQPWWWDGIDRHHAVTPEKEEPLYQHGWSSLGLSYMIVFLAFLPVTFFLKTIVYNTSDPIESLGEPPLGWGNSFTYLVFGASYSPF